jgi:hypothetical protein
MMGPFTACLAVPTSESQLSRTGAGRSIFIGRHRGLEQRRIKRQRGTGRKQRKGKAGMVGQNPEPLSTLIWSTGWADLRSDSDASGAGTSEPLLHAKTAAVADTTQVQAPDPGLDHIASYGSSPGPEVSFLDMRPPS